MKVVFNINQTGIHILDLIQWAHQNNKFDHSFGIGFHTVDHKTVKTFETYCPQLANAFIEKYPNAEIIHSLDTI